MSEDTLKVSLLGGREESNLQDYIAQAAYKVALLVPFLVAETDTQPKQLKEGHTWLPG